MGEFKSEVLPQYTDREWTRKTVSFISALEWVGCWRGTKRPKLEREVPERTVGINYLMLLITPWASVTSEKSGKHNNKKWRMRHQRLQNSKCPLRPKASMYKQYWRSWNLGYQAQPRQQRGIWKCHDILQQQAETSGPSKSTLIIDRTSPSGNHTLKDTGRQRQNEIKAGCLWVFFFF